MGALTSKVHSFVVRSWELEKMESIDIFDSLGTLIFIEKRNMEILRITPKKFNEFEWITDKVRFFFDSLKYQRLLKPLFFDNKVKKYMPITLNMFYFYLKSVLVVSNKSSQSYIIQTFVDDQVDVIDLLSLKSFIYNYGNVVNFTNTLNQLNTYNISNDFLNDFIINKKTLLSSSIIFFFGSDLRLELPVLFTLLLKKIKLNQIKLYIFGFVYYLNLKYKSIGYTLNDFYKFKLFKLIKLKKTDIIYFLYGSIIYNNLNFNLIYNYLNKLLIIVSIQYYINVTQTIIYNNLRDLNITFLGNSLNVLNKNYLLNKNEIQLDNYLVSFDLTFNIFINSLYIVNKKNKKISNNIVNLLFTSFFDFENLHIVDFKLPIPYLYEKDFYLITILGDFYKMKYNYFPLNFNKIKSLYLILQQIRKLLVKPITTNVFKSSFFLNKMRYKNYKFITKLTNFDFIINKNIFKFKSQLRFYEHYVFALLDFNFNFIGFNTYFLNTLYNYYNLELTSRLSSTLQLLSKEEIKRTF